MAFRNKPRSSRKLGPDSIPELEATSPDGACDTTRPIIGDDDGWLGDTIQDAVLYAGDHRTDVCDMMR